jgi:hypothetical protein
MMAHMPTDRMDEIRSADWRERRRIYRQYRLDDQITWYGDKAKYNARWGRFWVWVSIILQVAAIGAALFLMLAIVDSEHPAGPWLLPWQSYEQVEAAAHFDIVPVLTTIAAAVVAWAQAKHHDDLQNSYAQASAELRDIEHQLDDPQKDTEADFLHAVESGENSISREHTMWVAKTTSKVPPQAA